MKTPKHIKRGIATLADLKARCKVDPVTHCWIWGGATTGNDGVPAIHTFDHATGEKRVMSGPLAAWNIAHQAPPRPGMLVYRCCNGGRLCLNPAHLREAASRKEIGQQQKLSGRLKGTHVEARRANMAKAHATLGIVSTAPEIVMAIRSADESTTGRALSKQHGVSENVVSRIRRGYTHKHVMPLVEQVQR